MKKIILKYLVIVAASIIYSMGISLFLNPNNLAPGGLSGIAIMLNYTYGISTGLLIFIINIPLMVAGIWKFGFKFFISTIFAVILTSSLIEVFAVFSPLTTDPLVASLAGGVMLAFGMGCIFKVGATTGGSDIVIKLIKIKYKHIETGRLFLIMDSIIVAISAYVYKDITLALYSALTVYVISLVLDKVLYGNDGAKLVFIITEHEDSINTRIQNELHITSTNIDVYGGYTMHNKALLLCAMRKQNLPRICDIVKEVDDNAFLIVTSATEVYGQGYKEHSSIRL